MEEFRSQTTPYIIHTPYSVLNLYLHESQARFLCKDTARMKGRYQILRSYDRFVRLFYCLHSGIACLTQNNQDARLMQA